MTSTHEPFDETAKAFYQVVRCNDADQKRLQNTVFAHFRQFNALELKGFNDPLTVAN